MQRASLAKISRPRYSDVLRRERLFERLRDERGRVLCRLGEKERGLALIRRSRVEGRKMKARTIEYLTHMAQAEAALREGDEAEAVACLREGLAVAAAQGFVNQTWWCADVMSELYGLAAAYGIETEFVAATAALRGISIAERSVAARSELVKLDHKAAR